MLWKLNITIDHDAYDLAEEQAVSQACHQAAKELEDKLAQQAFPYGPPEVKHEVELVLRPCPCGSGEESEWERDARGIELCRCCDRCKEVKLAGFRTDVLENPNYEAEEPIEEV